MRERIKDARKKEVRQRSGDNKEGGVSEKLNRDEEIYVMLCYT